MSLIENRQSTLLKINPIVLAAFLLTYCAFMVFGSAGHDDSHITYAAAQNLADGFGLVNINGDKVEQSSSLLHTILLASISKIIESPIALIGTYLSFICALLCLPVFYQLLNFANIQNKHLPLAMLSLSTAFSYWSMGGLETSLLALILSTLALGLAYYLKQPTKLNFTLCCTSLSALVLTRPEGFFIAIASIAGIAILQARQGSNNSHRQLLLLAIVTILVFIALCYWRYNYFGQIFPQPVYAKSASFSIKKIAFGLGYFAYSAQLSIILLTLLLGVFAKNWLQQKLDQNSVLITSLAISVSYLCFIVISGGDWMSGGRFFAAVIPFMLIYSSYFFEQCKKPLAWQLPILAIFVIEIAFFAHAFSLGIPVQRIQQFQQKLPLSISNSNYSWPEKSNVVHIIDIQMIHNLSNVIDALPNQKLTISSVQMGMTPFYLKKRFGDKLHFVDMRGLTTKHLSKCKAFANYPRIWTGIFVHHSDYIRIQKQRDCKLPKLDIIYDLLNNTSEDFNQQQLAMLESAGYSVILKQQGFLSDTQGSMQLSTKAYIAVNQSIYKMLPNNIKNQKMVLSNHK